MLTWPRRARLILYRDADGRVPFLDWLESLDSSTRAKCRVRLRRLAELGHQLRRPEADYVENGIHELRAKHARINHRMLYFFHGREIVLTHGFTKQQARVPRREIELALSRKRSFEVDPGTHAHVEDA